VATIGGQTDAYLVSARSYLAADSRGRIIVTSDDSRVLVFHADGRLQGAFGRAGEAPDEFRLPHPQIAIGPGDSILAKTNLALKVFTPTFAWQRSFDLPDNARFVVFPDNTIVTLGWRSYGSSRNVPDGRPFHIVRPSQPVKAFGPAGLDPRCSACFLYSIGASADGSSLWVSTPHVHDLQRWSREGMLLEHMVFDGSPWFRPWDPILPRPGGLAVSRVTELREDQTGILWMRGGYPRDSATIVSGPRRADSPAPQSRNWVNVLEAYDVGRGQIVASLQIPERPFRLIGNNMAALMRTDSSGYVYWDLLRLVLANRSTPYLTSNPSGGNLP
jgi:hypothetical protein